MQQANAWLWGAALGLSMTLGMRGLLHLLQLESYQLPGYFRAVLRTAARSPWPGLALSAVTLSLGWAQSRLSGLGWTVAACLLLVAVGGVLWRVLRAAPAKRVLVFTGRVKRLLPVMLAVNLALAWVSLFLLPAVVAGLLPLLSVFWMALAALVALPMEKAIAHWYFSDAQKKLASAPYRHLLRIGITGSFGKTSVKYILGSLLSEKYRTLITPESYNTPMGVTRIIREQLQPEHEIFVAEMGARHVGDIREMCNLVSPKIGILTAVGAQHLETFGSLERIAQTKNELIEALPPEGTAFFARDGGWCETLFQRCPLQDKHLAGEGLTVSDVELGAFGSRFILSTDQGERVACQSALLGEHNIRNILLSATVARHLGLTLEQIANGIGKIQPVKNRLEVIPTGNGVMVINDGFSGNPAGTLAALAVLSDCPGRRFIVTPGMVEMGARQAQANYDFGAQMKGKADVAILVGKINSDSLRRGLLESGFDEGSVYLAESLEASQGLLGKMLRKGDTVLFSNDLPENYR